MWTEGLEQAMMEVVELLHVEVCLIKELTQPVDSECEKLAMVAVVGLKAQWVVMLRTELESNYCYH
jgi:hypothetical protein